MSEGNRLRISIIGVVVLGLFAALLARLWFLQVGSGEEFAVAAETNRTEVVQTEAPRGRILDREGRPLVTNRQAAAITMEPTLSEEDREASVGRLAELLRVDRREIEDRLDDERNSPLQPVTVAIDVPAGTVPKDALLYIREHQEDFPGVEALQMPVREYPQGNLAAHVLGYAGEINEEELELRADSELDYALGEQIGKNGVELTLEPDLRGLPEQETLEVDANRDVVGVLDRREAVPGNDVHLTLDIDIQRAAEDALLQGLEAASNLQNTSVTERFKTFDAPAGSVVVLDATSGDVVAMASSPSFSPTDFIGGIDPAVLDYYNNPESAFPLSNRALQGQYAVGSTFKLFTSLAALESGVRTPETTISDGGVYEIGDREFTNAGNAQYGPVDLRRALTVSSDVYFYGIGGELWARDRGGPEPAGDAIQQVARQYGFGEVTGIALPSEQHGRVPDLEWKQAFAEANGVGDCDDPQGQEEADRCTWFPGDNVNLAIGQGDFLATPLQLANGYAAFFNGGILLQPQIVEQVRRPDGEVVRTVEPTGLSWNPIDPEWREAIVDGLIGVVNSGEGTAAGIFDGFPDQGNTAGKTGTAEVNGKDDTSLFVGIWPARPAPGQPQYVVVGVGEESGFGSEFAAPVVRSVMDALAGVEPDPAGPAVGQNAGAVE